MMADRLIPTAFFRRSLAWPLLLLAACNAPLNVPFQAGENPAPAEPPALPAADQAGDTADANTMEIWLSQPDRHMAVEAGHTVQIAWGVRGIETGFVSLEAVVPGADTRLTLATRIPASKNAAGAFNWITAAVPPASYRIEATLADDAGHTAVARSLFNVNVVSPTGPPQANRPPTITLTQPAADLTLRAAESLTIAWTDDDDDNAAVRLMLVPASGAAPVVIASAIPEDADGPADQFTWIVNGLPPGAYQVSAEITDAVGQKAASVAAGRVSVTTDPPDSANVPPTLTLTAPVGTSTFTVGQDAAVQVAWTDADPDDDAAITLLLDRDQIPDNGNELALPGADALSEDADGPNGSYALAVAPLPAGSYVIRGRITDAAGQSGVSVAPGVISVVNPPAPPPPQIGVTAPADNATVTRGQLLDVAWTATFPGGAGVASVYADPDGNPHSGDEISLIVNRPVGPNADGSTVTWDTTPLDPGNYIIRAEMLAGDGSMAALASVQFHLVDNDPPSFSFLFPSQPITINAGIPVHIFWTDDDPDDCGGGDPAGFVINLVADTDADPNNGSLPIPGAAGLPGCTDGAGADDLVWDTTMVPSSPTGVEYRIRASVTDTAGNVTVVEAPGRVTVINPPTPPTVPPNQAPVISIVQPVANVTVQFDVFQIVTIQWSDQDPDNDAQVTIDLVEVGGPAIFNLVTNASENADGPSDIFQLDVTDIDGVGTPLPLGSYRVRARISDGVNPDPAPVLSAARINVVQALPEPVNRPPTVTVTEPALNSGYSQGDTLAIRANWTELDPDLVKVAVVLDLDDNPGNDSLEDPNETGYILLQPLTLQTAAPPGTFPFMLDQVIDLLQIPVRNDLDPLGFPLPYFLRVTVDDGEGHRVHAYAPGYVRVVNFAVNGTIDLKQVGRTLAGAVFQGFNADGRAGSTLLPLGNLSGDAADDFYVVARNGQCIAGVRTGESYLVQGRNAARFADVFNLNSVGTLVLPGTIICPPIGDTSEGIASVATVTFDGAVTNVLMGISRALNVDDEVDDDPVDNLGMVGVTPAFYLDAFPNRNTDGDGTAAPVDFLYPGYPDPLNPPNPPPATDDVLTDLVILATTDQFLNNQVATAGQNAAAGARFRGSWYGDDNACGCPNYATANGFADRVASLTLTTGNALLLSAPFNDFLDAAKQTGDSFSQLGAWCLQGVNNDPADPDRNTDVNGRLHVAVYHNTATVMNVVELYRAPAAGPHAVATGDVDGDNDVDIVVANALSGTVSIYLNDGTGTFTGDGFYPVGTTPVALVLADLDADGDLDLATANRDSGNVSILRNNGAGVLSALTPVTVGTMPSAIAAGNVDGDADIDLAVCNNVSANTMILLNNGSAAFTIGATLNAPANGGPSGCALGDIDVDGDVDLVVVNFNTSNASYFRNNAGVFTNAQTVATGTNPSAVILGPLDNAVDTDLDMAVANFTSNNISILTYNSATNLFNAAVNVNVGMRPAAIVAADLDNDGDRDLATANSLSNTVSVLTNAAGNAVYAIVDTETVGAGPVSIAAGLFNADAFRDLVTANPGVNQSLSLLTNSGAANNFNAATAVSELNSTGTIAAAAPPFDQGRVNFTDVSTRGLTGSVWIIPNDPMMLGRATTDADIVLKPPVSYPAAGGIFIVLGTDPATYTAAPDPNQAFSFPTIPQPDDMLIGLSPFPPLGCSGAGARRNLSFPQAFRLGGKNPGDQLGWAADADDFNQDGVADFICGAPGSDGPGGVDSGIAYIFLGRSNYFTNPPPDAIRLPGDESVGGVPGGLPRLELRGVSPGDDVGRIQQAVGDINGDGVTDLAFGVPLFDDGPNADAGLVAVVFGDRPVTGEEGFDIDQVGMTDANGVATLPGFLIVGEAPNQFIGAIVSGAGDFNGDGTGDLLVVVPNEVNMGPDGMRKGAAYLIFGGPHLNVPTAPSTPNRVLLSDISTANLPGIKFISAYLQNSPREAAITNAASAGDVDGDGFTDILFGLIHADLVNPFDPTQTRESVGEVYLVYGNATTGIAGP